MSGGGLTHVLYMILCTECPVRILEHTNLPCHSFVTAPQSIHQEIQFVNRVNGHNMF